MSQNAAIDLHAIRQRAHRRWLERGCPTGSAEQDWLDAERELAAESQASARTSTTVTSAAGPGTGSAPPVRLGVPRPRSIVTRSAYAPAARLLVALLPDASASVRIAGTPAPAPSAKGPVGKRGRR